MPPSFPLICFTNKEIAILHSISFFFIDQAKPLFIEPLHFLTEYDIPKKISIQNKYICEYIQNIIKEEATAEKIEHIYQFYQVVVLVCPAEVHRRLAIILVYVLIVGV